MACWSRRDVLRLPLGGALACFAAPLAADPLSLLPRVNGQINLQPVRRLGSDPRQPLIVPELVDLQLQAIYELGFDAVRLTLPFSRFGDDFLAASVYVRAARALGIDVLGVLGDFSGYDLAQALFQTRTRAAVLQTHLALLGAATIPASEAVTRTGTLSLQLFNEPTHALGIAPDNYVSEFLEPVHAELQRQAPGLIVVAAAEVGNTSGVLRLRSALAAGMERHCERIACHIYDPGVIPLLRGLSATPLWVTESGVLGTANHLAWWSEQLPAIREQIGSVERIFYFQLFDLQPNGFRMIDIAGDVASGFRALPESAALVAHLRARVAAAAGPGPHASYRELIPDITRYFPTAEDLRLIAQTPLPLTLLALLFVLAQAAPDYPWPQRTPDLIAPRDPLQLTDVRYAVVDENGLVQELGVRARLRNFGFVGLSVVDQARALSLTTYRLAVQIEEQAGSWGGAASYRAPRFLLAANGLRRASGQRSRYELEGAWRASSSFELLGAWLVERQPRPVATTPLRRVLLGALYQPSARLELQLEATSARVPAPIGPQSRSDEVQATAAGVLSGAELSGGLGFERRTGRLRGEQVFGSAQAAVPVRRHLLLEGFTSQRWERGVSHAESDYRGALTLFGRRVSLPRVREAGARTAALVRRANRLGANVRQVFDLDGQRALRETLALSPRRDELAEDIDGLYQAQVAERNVPQLGIRVERAKDVVRGVRTHTLGLLVGVPWPLASPLRRRDASVPFLTLDYARITQDFERAPDTVDHEASLLVSLNREMTLRLRHRKPGRTPLDLARITADRRRWELEYVYAYGR